jgi:hypothetical protein
MLWTILNKLHIGMLAISSIVNFYKQVKWMM